MYNNREGALSDMISLRNGQGRKVDGVSLMCDGNLANGNHGQCGGLGGGGILMGSSGCNNNNNNNNHPSFSSISSTSGAIGQVNSNLSGSPTAFYSQPMEASTQTSNSDSLLPATTTVVLTNGPSVNSSAGSGSNNSSTNTSFSDELCGVSDPGLTILFPSFSSCFLPE
jgi:hypothetical protein